MHWLLFPIALLCSSLLGNTNWSTILIPFVLAIRRVKGRRNRGSIINNHVGEAKVLPLSSIGCCLYIMSSHASSWWYALSMDSQDDQSFQHWQHLEGFLVALQTYHHHLQYTASIYLAYTRATTLMKIMIVVTKSYSLRCSIRNQNLVTLLLLLSSALTAQHNNSMNI